VKIIYFTGLLFVLIFNAYCADIQMPIIGDDLNIIIKPFLENKSTFIKTKVSNEWVDSTIFISDIGIINENINVGFRLLTANKQYIGLVFTGDKNTALLDIDGNGILDIEMENIFIPYWIFDNDTDTDIQTEFNEMLSCLRNIFQSDEGIIPNNKIWIRYNELLVEYQNGKYENSRMLAYRLWFYSAYGTDYPYVGKACLSSLANLYLRFNKTWPSIILEYLCENSLRIGAEDDATTYYHVLQKIDPEFIPGKIIGYRITKDENEKNQIIEMLKKEHPSHWLVKQYVN